MRLRGDGDEASLLSQGLVEAIEVIEPLLSINNKNDRDHAETLNQLHIAEEAILLVQATKGAEARDLR